MCAGYKNKEFSLKRFSQGQYRIWQDERWEDNKLVLAIQVLGTAKWFHVWNGYRVTNRNDTKWDSFVHWTVLKRNNPSKSLHSVVDGEIVEFDIIKDIIQKGPEASNVIRPGERSMKGSYYTPNHRCRYHWFNLWSCPAETPPPQVEQNQAIKGSEMKTQNRVPNASAHYPSAEGILWEACGFSISWSLSRALINGGYVNVCMSVL